jgi:uncharacterized membrane protein
MTDITSNAPRKAHNRQRRGAEFYVYFTLIFIFGAALRHRALGADVIRMRTLTCAARWPVPGPRRTGSRP